MCQRYLNWFLNIQTKNADGQKLHYLENLFNALFCLSKINLVASQQRMALLLITITSYNNQKRMNQPVFINRMAK